MEGGGGPSECVCVCVCVWEGGVCVVVRHKNLVPRL